jgi:hypothetical protein
MKWVFLILILLFLFYIIYINYKEKEGFDNEKSIYFLILNMDKNKDRYNNISSMLDKLNCNYSRIHAVDGSNMEQDIVAQEILQPRKYLIGQKINDIDTKETWIYDGTINKSFPNLNLNGHYGTKGLTISNIKAFKTAEKMNYDWYCILEDDAEINKDTYNKIQEFIQNPANKNIDIVLLDERSNGWGGACAVLYNKKIIPTVIEELHPLSEFSINSMNYGDPNLSNLWDWKLWKYINYINKKFATLPCVKSGSFDSTIDINNIKK